MSPLEQLKSVLCDPTGKCSITGSDEDRAIVDRALQALAEQPSPQRAQPQQGVRGYAMALNEIALKLRERYKTDLLATPLWAEFEKARNKFASSIAAPQPAQRKPLTRDQVKKLITATGYDTASPQERTDFINGIRHAETAHGIKENT